MERRAYVRISGARREVCNYNKQRLLITRIACASFTSYIFYVFMSILTENGGHSEEIMNITTRMKLVFFSEKPLLTANRVNFNLSQRFGPKNKRNSR